EQFSWAETDEASRAVFSADGRRLAIGGCDMEDNICIFDVFSNTPPVQLHFRGCVMSLAFSQDGQKLLAGSFYGRVGVWDFSSRDTQLVVQAGTRQIRGLGILADGQTLVSAGSEVSFWDLSSKRKLLSFRPRPTGFNGFAMSPDGRRLAVGALDGLITI